MVAFSGDSEVDCGVRVSPVPVAHTGFHKKLPIRQRRVPARAFGPLSGAGNAPAPVFRVYPKIEDWFSCDRAFHEGVRLYFIPYLIHDKRSHASLGVFFKRDAVRVKVPTVVPVVSPFW